MGSLEIRVHIYGLRLERATEGEGRLKGGEKGVEKSIGRKSISLYPREDTRRRVVALWPSKSTENR